MSDYHDPNTGEEFSDDTLEDIFEDHLNDTYGTVYVCGMEMRPGSLLREVDSIAFRESFNDWIDSEVQAGTYAEGSAPDEDEDED